jgi:beta-glucanase (GH16 family)
LSYDTSRWRKADGYSNNAPFNCWFDAANVTHQGGKMFLTLHDIPPAGADKAYACGEYQTLDDTYGYGTYSARLKAAHGDGVVTGFFVYSDVPHDEIDFEILGKNAQQVQLNYFVDGVGRHEETIDLGFDAAADYHTYTFRWSSTAIRWYVDGVLVRTVTAAAGTPLPNTPGKIYINLWNGIGVDEWLNAFTYPGTPIWAGFDKVQFIP